MSDPGVQRDAVAALAAARWAREQIARANQLLREKRLNGELPPRPRVSCPECGAPTISTRTYFHESLGQRVSYRNCRHCGHRFASSADGQVLYAMQEGERSKGLNLRCECGAKLHAGGTSWTTAAGVRKVPMVCSSCHRTARAAIVPGKPPYLEA